MRDQVLGQIYIEQKLFVSIKIVIEYNKTKTNKKKIKNTHANTEKYYIIRYHKTVICKIKTK